MKKGGADLPITFIIIVIVALISLAIITLFLSGQTKIGSSGTSTFQATSFCGNLCLRDNQNLPSNVEWTKANTAGQNYCEIGGSFASNFCGGSYWLDGQETTCTKITTCVLIDNNGNRCAIDETKCP